MRAAARPLAATLPCLLTASARRRTAASTLPGSLRDALAATARLVCVQTRAVACTISRLDGEQAHVLVSLRRGVRHEAVRRAGLADEPPARSPLKPSPAGSRRPRERLDDPHLADHLHEEHFRRLSYASAAVVPLVFQGQTVGLLELLDTRSRDFEPVLADVVATGTLIAAALAQPGGVPGA